MATTPQTATYTVNQNGNMNSTGAGGMVPVPAANPIGNGSQSVGLAPTPASDPYTVFNQRLADMLITAQKQSASNNTLLGGAKDKLTTESVAPAGPQAFNPQIFSGSQVAGQEALEKGFQPAITSIATQEANTAAAMGGISDTIKSLQDSTQPIVLQPGQSLVSRDGTVIKPGHQYTPQINPLTGLMDGFDTNTGTWASGDAGNAVVTPPPQSNSDLVGGVDFSGAATSTKPYAADPNYAQEVDSMYTQIKNSSPIASAQTIDAFIKSQVGGKSPVTGQMIISAASQYQIDPNLLAAVLGHESDFGTSGAATTTMNAGNVGNTGTSTQNYKSWQAGVNAAASEIARRMPGNPAAQPAKTATASTATSPVGGQFSPEATAKLQQLPPSMQKYADAGPLGIAYFNADRVPADLVQSVQTLSAKAGIPFVTSADVSGIKSIESVLSNLDSMKALATKNLGTGVLGHLNDSTIGAANEALQTGWGINLGLFDNYRDTAIKAVQALAGGAGSGLRINGAEIAANTENLPKSGDSQENAIANISQLKQLIYINLANTFPYAMAKVTAPDGSTGNMPIGNLSQAILKGYSVQ